jgi:hypothetical protein
MKTIKIREEEITDFNRNPKLRELMVNYFHLNYERSATDEELIIEYNYLDKKNKLYLLFECEGITYYARYAGVPIEDS